MRASAAHLSEFSISEPRKRNYMIHNEALHAWEPNEASFMKQNLPMIVSELASNSFVWSFQFQIENPLFYPEKIYVQYVYISEKFFKRNLSISGSRNLYMVW